MKRRLPYLVITCAFALAGCPSIEGATKDAHDFDERSLASAVEHLEAERALRVFDPPLRSVPAADAKPADARDPALRGCLFDVGAEVAFDEANCAVTGANDRDRRYYRNGTKVVVVRLVAIVADEESFTDSKCLQSGLSGGMPTPMPKLPDPNEPPSPPVPRMLRVLGAVSAADVSMRDVPYPIHVVSKVCTGSYQTLGYPP